MEILVITLVVTFLLTQLYILIGMLFVAFFCVKCILSDTIADVGTLAKHLFLWPTIIYNAIRH